MIFESLLPHYIKTKILALDVAIMACYDCACTDNAQAIARLAQKFNNLNKNLAVMSRFCWIPPFSGGVHLSVPQQKRLIAVLNPKGTQWTIHL